MKKIRVLSIDGGGIRGVIPAVILTYVEKRLQLLSRNKNTRLADYFDMVVGTSTGGILSCFYLTPNPFPAPGKPTVKYTAEQALEFYAAKGFSIFNQSKRKAWFGARQLFNATQYSPKKLEQIFNEEFGDLKFHELTKHCLITTYNMEDKNTFFFSREEPALKREFYVRDVVRSTSAAPTYFPPAKIYNLKTGKLQVNIDGGVFANNPSMCAYAECRSTNFEKNPYPSAKDMLILSIGTGGGQFALPSVKNSNKWGVINWAKSIPEIMMDGSIDTVNYQMRHLFATLERKHEKNYKRIDVLAKDRNYAADMADASPENIAKLKLAGEKTLQASLEGNDESHGLNDFIDQLMENH